VEERKERKGVFCVTQKPEIGRSLFQDRGGERTGKS
jgi:hypothetical protein